MTQTIYTVGYSNHSFEEFMKLLQRHGITAIADVRTMPVSKHNPQFNRDILSVALRKENVSYVFMGKELGGRPNDPSYYYNGQADYHRMAENPIFKEGINKILKDEPKYRIALLCAEKEPLACHRTILVSRVLHEMGIQIKHILANGEIEDHQHTEQRMVASLGIGNKLFDYSLPMKERIGKAYQEQARKIAYKPYQRKDDENTQKKLSPDITLYTIGFTKKNARTFFLLLKQAGVKKIIDIRLNNTSQLAGFTKNEDLKYFLKVIANIDYIYRPELAPTKEILDDYKKKKIIWIDYEKRFSELLNQRKPETLLTLSELDKSCLLCSEAIAAYCHRRLVAEYLKAKFGNLEIHHL